MKRGDAMTMVVNDTVLSTGVGLDATVASDARIGAAVSQVPVSQSMVGRTTVLPRVETVGAHTRVVVDELRRFDLLKQLGEGGLGEVTGVLDNDIGRRVAIKRLRGEVKSATTALRFAEEVRTVGQLEHPNIVPIHDVGVDESGDYYFVMKYIDGETLESIIEKLAAGDVNYHIQYGFERRVQIFTSVLEAVAFAHTKGIVHRDIKPANVMIGAYGEVVLMDWGIAKRTGNALPDPTEAAPHKVGRRGTLFETRTGELVGTPAYASPEQVRGEKIDERTDVYSLSLLFYEFLCLKHPLESKQTLTEMLDAVQNEKVLHASGVSSPYQAPTPAELAWFTAKGLEKDPTKRFQSVREMIDRIERRAEGDFPIQCPITLSKRALYVQRRFIDRHPYFVMGALPLVVLAMLGAFIRTIMILAR